MGKSVAGRRGGRDRQPGGRDARRARGPRQRGQPPWLRARGASRVTRVAADAADAADDGPAGRGRLRHLQLRQPAVSPLARRLAADRRQRARRRGTQRRGTGHAVEPVRLRPRAAPAGYDEAHPMTEATPLAATGRKGRIRARVWQDALAAHQAGRVRVTEVRAADFIGPGAQSAMGERIVRRLGRERTSRCSAAPTGRTPGRSPTTWPACWSSRAPTPGPGGAPGTCRRTSRAASARSSTTSPGPPGSVRSASARSPRCSCAGWDSSRRSCGSCARPSTSSATTSSWTPRPLRPTFGLKPAPWEEIVAVTVRPR